MGGKMPAPIVTKTHAGGFQCLDGVKSATPKRWKVDASTDYLEMKLREGALAHAKYLQGKRRFARSQQDFTFFSGPENDGWDTMCEGSSEWDDFKESLKRGKR